MNNPTKKIDFVKFAKLKLGVAFEDCKEVLLSHWKEPRASDEGFIFLYKFGCSLRVDVNGKVGNLSYFGNFPKKRVVAKLRLGASFDDAKELYPGLNEEVYEKEGWQQFSQHLSENERLVLRFNQGILRGMDILNPNAIYPKKEDFDFNKLFPKASIHPCPFFEDENFKFVVLSELLEKDLIKLGSPEELASFVLGRYIDFDEDEEITGYDSIAECREYLAKYPLSKALLENIEELYFDGSLEIYRYICYQWDGESGEFDVKSLKGCENLPNLKKLSMYCMNEFTPDEQNYIDGLKSKGIEVNQ